MSLHQFSGVVASWAKTPRLAKGNLHIAQELPAILKILKCFQCCASLLRKKKA